MTEQSSVIRVSKLEAAHRQLRTAITLWFTDGDPVSVHALVFAAYEVLHTISKKRNPSRRDLLWDSYLVKEEYRSEFNKRIKQHAYFFKHADRDPEGAIDFNTETNEWYMIFAVVARQLCGEMQSQEESTFLWWLQIDRTSSQILAAKKWPTFFRLILLRAFGGCPSEIFLRASATRSTSSKSTMRLLANSTPSRSGDRLVAVICAFAIL